MISEMGRDSVNKESVIAKAILVMHSTGHVQADQAQKILDRTPGRMVEMIRDILYRRGLLQKRVATGDYSLSSLGEKWLKDNAEIQQRF
ncbi:hypothetical protein [Acetonema longum]|uniref:Uncharacterized protein n=1 Tax=Acetonema longum DSM 6540 TaxID=1009370 RepID=F7NKC7_9FIRM|nr:hypothetical protein [Acetonema longum]EGO63568.1 hypothetical protein ALO_12701 [Acetonema longum DSM 6540]